LRGEREGKEGVGREERDVFLRGWGDSERMARDFRMPLFRLCLREVWERGRGTSAGKMGRDEDWIMELRKGNVVSGSVG